MSGKSRIGICMALGAAAISLFSPSMAQDKKAVRKDIKKEIEKSAYNFIIDKEVRRTPVKDQAATGTCWCFSTVSFLESELLRMGKGEVDLSEMFVVRYVTPKKAQSYIRLHGAATFSQGGQSHDVMDALGEVGIVPDSLYPGLAPGEKRHNHSELFSVLKSMLDAVLKGSRPSPRWSPACESILDIYLGTPPSRFLFKGREYTPVSFAKDFAQIRPGDYVEFTSYSHLPFDRRCRLDVPDNWSFNDQYYNVPVGDLEAVADYALSNGYSLVWDGDVSEKDFSTKTGYAIVPAKDVEGRPSQEWGRPQEQEPLPVEPVEEKEISQEMRQKTYDDMSTTDDHLMHIVGLAHDQKGTKFYLTKNSSGKERKYDGYVYLSRSYFRLKTTALMVHKDAVPPYLKNRLGMN